MHQALYEIYELKPQKKSLFKKLKSKLFAYLNANFDKLIDEVWKDKVRPDAIPAELFNNTYTELNKQVDDAFGKTSYGDEDYTLANELRKDAAKFSSYRNYQFLAELEAKKIDTITGEVLNEADYKKVAKGVHYKYQNYAEVEKDLAFKTADMAVKWQEFERTKDLYPNLEYRPSKAAEPREAHKQYYGLIKPIDDAIWESILPPNGWGCSCTVRKTRAEADDASYEVEKPKPGIVGNGAKSKQLFADNHPYYKNTPKEAKEKLEIQKDNLYRKLVRDEAFKKANKEFKDNTYYNNSIDKKIGLNNKGLKEILNQPHDNIIDKNMLVNYLDKVINKAELVKTIDFDKNKKGSDTFKLVHYFNIPMEDKDFYAVVREKFDNTLWIYSIVDKLK